MSTQLPAAGTGTKAPSPQGDNRIERIHPTALRVPYAHKRNHRNVESIRGW